MLSLLSFAYLVPLVVAMLITGLVVNRRIGPSARGFLWTGITLLAVSQSTSLLTTALIRGRTPTWTYSAVNLLGLALMVSGVVVLILAVGRAARERQPGASGPVAPTGYPSPQGWPGDGRPAVQPGPGIPGHPAPPGSGQPGHSGQWNDGGPWQGRP